LSSGAAVVGAAPSRQQASEPIRAELWGVERLEQHAAALAAEQRVRRGRLRDPRLRPRVWDNGRVLLDAYRTLAASIRDEPAVTPATEWLVDNFHLIEDQLREIREDLPATFYHELPRLAAGRFAGYPRVYALAHDFVAHTDSRFDSETLRRFVGAYQEVLRSTPASSGVPGAGAGGGAAGAGRSAGAAGGAPGAGAGGAPLTSGELWAVAISLRIVLIENLRRLAEHLVRSRAARRQAERLADGLLGIGPAGSRRLPPAAPPLAGDDDEPLDIAFAVVLLERLHGHGPEITPALAWLNQRLAAQGTTADEIVAAEHQRQTAMNLSVRNAITSLRLISTCDWAAFFESVSLVDEALCASPGYRAMAFATRDRYRHGVEELARGSGLAEVEVARRAVARALEQIGDARLADPGTWLIGGGRRAFERALGYRVPPRQWLRRAHLAAGAPGYVGLAAAATALALAVPLWLQARAGVAPHLPPALAALLGLLALWPASELAMQLVNSWVMEAVGPQVLPRLELRGGVPAGLRTLVVVPALLTSATQVEELIARLEIHHLASLEDELRFALLSDWSDAPAAEMPGDEEMLAAARGGIARLNARYGRAPGGEPRFLLLHRRRVWSAGEGSWLGWERKRGKLEELNRLLLGADGATFLDPAGADGADGGVAFDPRAIRYVLTLDADTQLPRDAARRLIGTLAHPLNQARFDPRSGRVVEGYGILQPRITPILPHAEGSLFQRIFSGPAGIDPYAAAVSDVYQDLFGEGSFTGKGIYDVEAFSAALAGRVPENTLLSHDLFEGIFARAGLVTDVELCEEFPAHTEAAGARLHRWARGDWQLLPWILGRGPADAGPRPPAPPDAGRRRRPPIPLIGRFKMLDNLRRTLVAPASFLLLAAAWTLPGAAAPIWSGFWLATLAVPALLPPLLAAVPRRRGIGKRNHLRTVAGDLGLAAARIALTATFLAHQAWLMADAIGRSLARLHLTRRHLLQWVTAAQAKSGLRLDLAFFCRRMAGGLVLAAAVVAALSLAPAAAVGGGTAVRLWAAPLVLLWLLAPLVAWRISQPPPAPAGGASAQLAAGESPALRRIARRTWRFAETFVTAEDHWLPPDNFQETPQPVVAHRTSPTNIGLYLLEVAAAHDFGWLGLIDCVERLEATLGTVAALEHHRGHLYNWYDTRDLRPLDPRYVSTVDSGNLAGHLIALAGFCGRLGGRPLLGARVLAGIGDAVELLRAAAPPSAGRRTQTVTRRDLDEALAALDACLRPPPPPPLPPLPPLPPVAALPPTPAAWTERMDALAAAAHGVVDVARALASEQSQGTDAAAWGETLAWAELTQACVASHRRDLDHLLSWARRPRAPGGATDQAGEAAPGAAIPGTPAIRGEGMPSLASLWEGARQDQAAGALGRRLERLAEESRNLSAAMDMHFLYDQERRLFAIGYRVAEGELDTNYYDLLASEARLASFIAIAKGDVPAAHWFQLGRPLTPVGRGAALVSWSGSMFEYLMPELVMRAPAHSLLDQTCRLVVRRQIEYGGERGVPWGMSESAFNARDLSHTYQYGNFGVPGLGLKRGLSQDVVVAPYATGLAAMLAPREAGRNLVRLTEAGGSGRYGFYEAIDYTPGRLPEGQDLAVVRAYMAHHQGMMLVALANTLDPAGDGAMPAHFHAAPAVQATELLLQERTPRDVAVARPRAEEVAASARIDALQPPVVRRYDTPHGPIPRTHLLSNGRYAVMLTAAGGGYSRVRDLAVTRYREDATRDSWGSFIFLREMSRGTVWSAGFQPSGAEPDSYEALFAEDRVQISRRDGAVASRLDVVVAPEDDAEMRQVTLTCHGPRALDIELTTYAEVVLAPQAADIAHPAYSNLFVETEFVPALGALLASRRPRAAGEERVWAAHVVTVSAPAAAARGLDHDTEAGGLQFETDRLRFLGRGRGVRTPMSVIDGRPLANTAGAVLDPIFSLRRRVRLWPGAAVRVAFTTLVAPSRQAALDLAAKYRDPAAFERAATMAWTRAQVELRHLGISAEEANLFQRLANRLLFVDPALRSPAPVLARLTGAVQGLWAQGISGDLPIVLVRTAEADDLALVRQLLRAQEYFRAKRLAADLVVVNEQAHSYVQELQDALGELVRASQARHQDDNGAPRGGAFLLRAAQLGAESLAALELAARVVLAAGGGTLAEQLAAPERAAARPAWPAPGRRPSGGAAGTAGAMGMTVAAAARGAAPGPPGPADTPPTRPDLEHWNGLGGFAEDGREYMTVLGEGQWTPAPWINVVANPGFGFLVSESGGGYTWSGNSRENQLTPWSNDPVSDPPGDVLYVRDEETGELWGPTVLPIREEAWVYVARHGQGYSRFEHSSHGVALELLQLVPLADPVKISRLTLRNRDSRPRRLSVTAYVEWVLGSARAASAPFLVTAIDGETGALVVRNSWVGDLGGGRVAFADLGGRQTAWTGSRTEFLGRNGTLDHPAALEDRGHRLSGTVGAGLDPCAALQGIVELPPLGQVEILYLLGECGSAEEARQLVRRYRAAPVDDVLAEVMRHWTDVAGAIQVRTPDRSMDLMLNRWLGYQTLSCRVWARTAFYQAGGAYGFRDQLQDVMALTVARREVAREHILRAAARQFVEGDVQHWWHPPSGRGVRTRISDDLLWLPYAVLHYLEVTGERELLDEPVPFLTGPPLTAGQEDAYFAPAVAEERATLYEHCARALDLRLATGRHGLPLIGTGDWNDAMNRIGRGGQGESVWLGWFLHILLWEFALLAEARGEAERARTWRDHRSALARALEEAWDGDWYRRAYFDDGTPLGSAGNDECRIDSIAQSWAVLAGAADRQRSTRAMAAVEEYLVKRGDALVLLFTPPFDHTALDPGYIKGYLPGVRENGGQYTHAAIWCILAFAALGEGDLAGELFSILNPINQASTRAGIQRYKVEPYVTAADIYADPGHLGRGGWTWYTGSAGWMYRAGIEWILGFRLRGAVLSIDPAIPRAWTGYEITFRYHSASYVVSVENPRGATRGVTAAEIDGAPLPPSPQGAADVALVKEGNHRIRVTLG
jgi:cyclic beta-1,2-glucan synthetase